MPRNSRVRLWLFAFATLLVAASAVAHPIPPPPSPLRPVPPGKADLKVEYEGGQDRVVLRESGGSYAGTFAVRNDGERDVELSVVRPRTTEADKRLPDGITGSFASPDRHVVIHPHDRAEVRIAWAPPPSAPEQAIGHMTVQAITGDSVAAGFEAHRSRVSWFSRHALSCLTFFPLAGILVVLLSYLSKGVNDRPLRWLGVVVSGAELALATWLAVHFDPTAGVDKGNDGLQFIERHAWVPSFGVEYAMGVNGVSLSLAVLSALIFFVAALSSFSIERHRKGYYAMFFLLMTATYGVFFATDAFLFYVFWELVLLPMYFLIGIWGGPRKEYAALKFFLYTLSGGVLMLLAFIALYLTSDPGLLIDGTKVTHSFFLPELARSRAAFESHTVWGIPLSQVAWCGLFAGFAVKIPVFPVHTWLPDAHVEAPTPVSVLLAGILLKMGVFGLLQWSMPLLPGASAKAAGALVGLGAVNVVYGALCALGQSDLKKLVAYSSISHMGFCLIGIGSLTSLGVTGCVFQMVSHGITSALLFLLVGVVYDRAHTRDLGAFGGLTGEMPLYACLFGLAFMASLGLPGLSGFWGEAFPLFSAMKAYRTATVVAASGLVLSAAYHLWAVQRVLFGSFDERWRKSTVLEAFGGRFPDVSSHEVAMLLPLGALSIVLGVWPRPVMHWATTFAADTASYVSSVMAAHP